MNEDLQPLATTRPTVLVVDDDHDIREMLSVGLGLAGYTVLAAGDGVRAVELASTEPVDVIISDLKMPGMEGAELVATLRRQAPRAVIVLATGYLSPETIAHCLAEGATDCIRKPFTMRELEDSLRRALAGRTLGPPRP